MAVLVTPPLCAMGGASRISGLNRGGFDVIDWLSLRLERDNCLDWGGWKFLQNFGDRILRICPRTGCVKWETSAWDSVRSDSHQIAVRCSGTTLYIHLLPCLVGCGLFIVLVVSQV